MKKLIQKDWLIWLILIAPFAVIAYYWNQFPDRIPVRWDINGEPEDYSNKTLGLFLMPVLSLLIYGMFKALPYIDPKKYNYKYFEGKWHVLQLVILSFMAAMAIASFYVALGYNIKMDKVAQFGVPLLMLIMGNYLSSIRPNYFIGIRTPWTLHNEQVWVKTHRLTGKLWVAASLIMIIINLFIPFSDAILISYLAALVLPPYIYSYLLFRKYEKNTTNHFML